MVVNTPYGAFTITRKDTVAISVIRIRHYVVHHRKGWKEGDISHIEHRRIPSNMQNAKHFSAWADRIATFDLDGKIIELMCCKNKGVS